MAEKIEDAGADTRGRDDGHRHGESRRQFCAALGAAAATASLLGATAPIAEAAAQESRPGPGEKRIEGAELLMPGGFLLFYYPTERDPAILVRGPEGGFHAYSQSCTHRSCSVHFSREHCRLECPCHLGAYDLRTGAVLGGPPQRPLDRITLAVRSNGEVWATGRKNTGPVRHLDARFD